MVLLLFTGDVASKRTLTQFYVKAAFEARQWEEVIQCYEEAVSRRNQIDNEVTFGLEDMRWRACIAYGQVGR